MWRQRMCRVARWRLGPGVAFRCEPVHPAAPAAVARAAHRASANAASSRLNGTTATVVRPPDVTSSVLGRLDVAVPWVPDRPITPPHLAVGQRFRACQSSAMDRIGAQRQMRIPALAAGPVRGPAPVGRRARAVLTRSMDASGRPGTKLLAVCAFLCARASKLRQNVCQGLGEQDGR